MDLNPRTDHTKQRLVADLIVFFSLLYMPWWATLILAILCLFMFEHYFEILIVGVALDSLYNTAWHGYTNVQFILSAICLIVYVISFPLKRRLTLYRN